MKKILLTWLFIIWIFVNFGFAENNLLYLENIQRYNLKNLDSDLKKDYSSKECNWWADVTEKYCNSYQLEGNNDKLTKKYIKYLKDKKYSLAANIIYNTNRLAHPSYAWVILWAVWYKDWIMWILGETQALGWRLFYITIKDNILYKLESKLWIWIEPTYSSDNTSRQSIKISVDWYYDDAEIHKYYPDFWLKYLQWKEKSKTLDEFQNSFKAKVKKLFK